MDVTFCDLELRNLENLHRGNATKRLRGCIISLRDYYHCYMCNGAYAFYNITWRGLTALLILGLGQCEGLKVGIS